MISTGGEHALSGDLLSGTSGLIAVQGTRKSATPMLDAIPARLYIPPTSRQRGYQVRSRAVTSDEGAE